MLLIPCFSFSQNCSANPGGDRAICQGDPMILFGEDSEFYLHPLDLTWSVVSSPIPVSFSQDDILQPTVTPTASGASLANGIYEFQLRVTCIDGEDAFANLTVTVGEIINPATILSPSGPSLDICGSAITIQGSAPDPGVSTLWLINPDLDVDLFPSADGQSVEVIRENGRNNCDFTIYYYQNIGSCESIDSIQVHFTQEYSSLSINYIEPNNCPSCSRRILVCGTSPGCDGKPLWGVIDPPADVTIETPENTCTWITVADDGDYTFSYTIENGDCSTTSVTSTCSINEIAGFGLESDQFFVDCVDTWDIESLDLSVNFMAGVNYQWSASSTMGNGWISFTDPNSASTTVNFAGTPVALPDGLDMTISVTASYNGCVDVQRFRYRFNPTVSVDSENVNLLCGGDPFFIIRDYINVGVADGSLKAEVLASPSSSLPVESTFFIGSNTNLDLTTDGTYSFLITLTQTGTTPGSNVSVTCTDEVILNVFVAEIPTINAGSDIVTCLLATQLNGNQPLDTDGHPVDIPVLWELMSGQTGVVIDSPTDQDPFISGLQFGETYTLRYTFSDTEDCMLVDEMQIQVQPESECITCELEVKTETCIDGCIQANVGGADTYLWVPADGIDDPTSDNPTFCNVSGTYTVYGFIDGEACGFAQIEIPTCESPIDCDGFYVDAYCTTCGCGEPAVVLRLYDSNGNVADDEVIDITWTINGNTSGTSQSSWGTHYDGPLIYSVNIMYTTAGGEVCDTTITGVKICGDDCYSFSIGTCADPNFADHEKCSEYGGDICENNGYGYLFVLDDVGNLVGTDEFYVYEVNGETYYENPFLYTPNWEDPCGPIEIRIYNFWGGCDTTIQYTLDCCSHTPPAIDCTNQGENGSGITWAPLCGSEYYEVQMLCLSGNSGWNDVWYEYVSEPDGSGYYSYTPDYSECDFWVLRVRGYCSDSKSFGPWSDCVLIDTRHPCFIIEDEVECDFWLPNGYDYGEGRGKEDGSGRSHSVNTAALAIGPTQVYPNPVSTDEIFVRISPFLTAQSEQENLEIRIVDVGGRVMQTTQWNVGETQQPIIISDLLAGLYFVTIYSEAGEFLEAKRLIRQ